MPAFPCCCKENPCVDCFGIQPSCTVSGPGENCAANGVYPFAGLSPGCSWGWQVSPPTTATFTYTINVTWDGSKWAVEGISGPVASYANNDADLSCVDGVITGTVVLTDTLGGCDPITVVFG